VSTGHIGWGHNNDNNEQCFHAHLPGFEGFREGTTESQIMKLVARHQLTHQLTLVTKPVSDECAAALQDIYTESKGKGVQLN
jgi:hypothetical protein